jgi:23S rRNA (adenine2503-C2)-methyltransferase
MQITKKNLRLFDKEELIKEMEALGEKKFRTSQLFQWLWKYRTLDFSEMKNIPKPLQAKLHELYDLPETSVSIFQQSQDGTIKVGFETYDKETIEGVIIPSEDRITACISSQVGCSLSCTFCATGFLPRKRNLFAFEIYDQVFLLNELALKHYEKPLTNIVYMGMGEPLLNYDEVVKSLHRLHSEDEGLGIGAKRITVSTSGIVRNIKKLADEGLKINLALSLHAANNDKRTAVMDINKSNPLEELMAILAYFYEKTHNKITYEYILLNQFNDSAEDAIDLAKLCQDFPVYVNLIEYNPVDGAPYSKSKKERRDAFLQTLRDKGVSSKVRKSRGKDIDAACGQLANKIVKLQLDS